MEGARDHFGSNSDGDLVQRVAPLPNPEDAGSEQDPLLSVGDLSLSAQMPQDQEHGQDQEQEQEQGQGQGQRQAGTDGQILVPPELDRGDLGSGADQTTSPSGPHSLPEGTGPSSPQSGDRQSAEPLPAQNQVGEQPQGEPEPAAPPRAPNSISYEDLLNNPIPIGKRVLCRVVRSRGAHLYPRYDLFLEGQAGRTIFLLAAKKSIKSRQSNYRISSSKTDFSKAGKHFRGKLKANFVGTHFTAYGRGKDFQKTSVDAELRNELASICYESNIIGLSGPRRMTVLMPGLSAQGTPEPCTPKTEKETLFARSEQRDPRVLVLHNKTPQWSEESQSFVLNFGGRVSIASVKNFQLISERDPEYIALQFGRAAEDIFSLDFQFPFSALQAFAIALSSFDGKIACE